MEKCDVLTFPKLHSILVDKGIIGVRHGTPQADFYTYLFYLDSKSLTISNGRINLNKALPSNEYQKDVFQNISENVSRWCNGHRSIDNSILKRVSADPETAIDDFKRKLTKLIYELDIPVPKEIDRILTEYIEKDLLNAGILADDKGNKYDAFPDILACAFVEALINENIQKEIKKIELLNKIKKTDENCKSQGFFTSAPFLLQPFIQRDDSLLIKAVKSLDPQNGNRVADAINEYCQRKTHSGSHASWSIEESDVFFYAKKYAYIHGCPSVGEREILLALFLADSKSMAQIANLVGGEQALKDAINASYRHATSALNIMPFGKAGTFI